MKNSDLIIGLMASFGKEEYTISQLLHLSHPFQVTNSSLRTILSRLTVKQVVESRKEGKRYFIVSAQRKKPSFQIAKGFIQYDWNGWDETWWGVLFSVPDLNNPERYRIRKKLTAYRFALLQPGFWIRPRHHKKNGNKTGFPHPESSLQNDPISRHRGLLWK